MPVQHPCGEATRVGVMTVTTQAQRLRVFISSVLGELEAERIAARQAVEGLRLVPAFGASLEQSQIFIGVYWQEFGSDIADEYRRSADRPRLIYLREPAPARDARLTALLDHIRAGGAVSYRRFSTPRQLAHLIRADLVLVLSDRFEDDPSFEHHSLVQLPTGQFIGRGREMNQLRQLLGRAEVRLVTLTGQAGIGKTRLAMQLASETHGDIVVVDLLRVPQPGAVSVAMAEALRIPTSSDVPALDALRDYLRRRNLKVLITSRERLRIAGEHEFAIPPLAEAVELFTERARSANSSFEPSPSQLEVIANITRTLDGLPLAIELAAAHLGVGSPEWIRDQLKSRLESRSSGHPDLPPHDHIVSDTIDWSYDLLGYAEQRLFARLSVFAGGFSLRGAAAVADHLDDGHVFDLLSSLVSHGLVQPVGSDAPRFAMSPVVREFAFAQLAARGDVEPTRRAHAEYVRTRVVSAAAFLLTSNQDPWIDRLRGDLDDIRAALRWSVNAGETGRLAHIAGALWPFWWACNLQREAEQWLLDVRESGADVSPAERAIAEWALGTMRYGLGDLPAAEVSLTSACTLARAAAQSFETHASQALLGLVVGLRGDTPRAEDLIEAALAGFRALDHAWGSAWAQYVKGRLLHVRGSHARAAAALETATADASALGEKWVDGRASLLLGLTYLSLGRHADAWPVLMRSVELIWSFRNFEGTADALEALANLSVAEGHAELGAVLFGAAAGSRAVVTSRVPFPGRGIHARTERELRAALGAAAFSRKVQEGADLTPEQALEVVAKGGRSLT